MSSHRRIARLVLALGIASASFWPAQASARFLGSESLSGRDPVVFLDSHDLKRARSLFVDFDQPGTQHEIEGSYAVNCFKDVKYRRVEYAIPPGFATFHAHPRKLFRRPDTCYIDAEANFKSFPQVGTITITARGISRTRR